MKRNALVVSVVGMELVDVLDRIYLPLLEDGAMVPSTLWAGPPGERRSPIRAVMWDRRCGDGCVGSTG